MGPVFAHKLKWPSIGEGLLPMALVTLLGLAPVIPHPAQAQIAEGNPRLALPASQLDQPFETPVFVVGYASLGGDFQKQATDYGYGGALIFRPGHAVNIFSSFLGWDTGMVIQIDYLKVPDGGDIISGDLIMRRYFNDRGDRTRAVNLFLGLGSGVSDIRRPEPGDDAAGEHWSILVEGGQEWHFKDSHLFFLKGQYRWMVNAGRTWRAWSVMAGLGLVWP